MATGLSIVLYNVARYILIWVKFRIQPFTWWHLVVCALAITISLLVSMLPTFGNYMMDIAVRSVLITVLFIPTVFFLEISEDFNSVILETLRRIGIR